MAPRRLARTGVVIECAYMGELGPAGETAMITTPGRVNASATATAALRAAVVVTRNPHQRLLDGIMDARDVDVVFVESAAGAYSTVKRVRPGLVVCLSFDDPLGFQVLSMLKLDRDTSRIPIVTSFAAAEDRDELSRVASGV